MHINKNLDFEEADLLTNSETEVEKSKMLQ